MQSTQILELIKYEGNNIFIKRDDLIPFSFGGNKARKAKLFFEDLINNKYDCVVTYGSFSSNHCRVVANMASSNNLSCYIITPNEGIKETENRKMIKLFGAKFIECELNLVKETIDNLLCNLKAEGKKPYFIQGGGHGNIGTQAYVDAFNEILYFEKEKKIKFDYIFHASGTGTTQAGLICGNLINNSNKKIVGISIARKNPYGKKVVYESVKSYLDRIYSKKINIEDITFIDNYIGEGYGYYNSEIINVIKQILTFNGIPLDTTYTGKAFWGMKEHIKLNKISDKNILFIHTGGTPLFFDDLNEIVDI